MCGVAAGATRGLITVHFCENGGDFAEVQAKEGTQETAITLVGCVLGIALSDLVNATPARRWAWFVLLTFIHVVSNFHAVSVIKFRSLNLPRLKFVVDVFNSTGTVPSPAETSENVWSWWRYKRWSVGSQLQTGMEIKEIKNSGRCQFVVSKDRACLRVGCGREDIINAAVALVGGKQGVGWEKKLKKAGWNTDDIAFRVGDWRWDSFKSEVKTTDKSD